MGLRPITTSIIGLRPIIHALGPEALMLLVIGARGPYNVQVVACCPEAFFIYKLHLGICFANTRALWALLVGAKGPNSKYV